MYLFEITLYDYLRSKIDTELSIFHKHMRIKCSSFQIFC